MREHTNELKAGVLIQFILTVSFILSYFHKYFTHEINKKRERERGKRKNSNLRNGTILFLYLFLSLLFALLQKMFLFLAYPLVLTISPNFFVSVWIFNFYFPVTFFLNCVLSFETKKKPWKNPLKGILFTICFLFIPTSISCKILHINAISSGFANASNGFLFIYFRWKCIFLSIECLFINISAWNFFSLFFRSFTTFDMYTFDNWSNIIWQRTKLWFETLFAAVNVLWHIFCIFFVSAI